MELGIWLRIWFFKKKLFQINSLACEFSFKNYDSNFDFEAKPSFNSIHCNWN